MAGGFGDDLSRIFDQPEDPPSMEALLGNANEPPQVPPAAADDHQHPVHPVAVDPHVQPVAHPANAVIPGQHVQPPPPHMLGGGGPPAPMDIFAPPPAMPLHHQNILAPPVNLPPVQMLPAPTMPVHNQHPPAVIPAAAPSIHGQNTQGESSSQPVQHQLGDWPPESWSDFLDDINFEDLDIEGILKENDIDNVNIEDVILNLNDLEVGSSGSSDGGATALQDCTVPAAPVFVPVSKAQLYCCDCDCETFREVRHVNGRLAQFLVVHRDPNNVSRFLHAFVARMNNGVHGQNIRQELLRLDLRGRTYAWVLRFIARSMEIMRNAGGVVSVRIDRAPDGEAGGSSSGVGASSGGTDEAEIAMLCELFGTDINVAAAALAPAPAPSPAAAQVGASANRLVVLDTPANDPVDAAPAARPRQFPSTVSRRQQRRNLPNVSAAEEEEIRQFLIGLKEDAERALGRQLPVALRKLLKKDKDFRTIANRMKANNKKLRNMWEQGQRRSGKDLLMLKANGIAYVDENRGLFDTLVREALRLQREEAGGRRCTPAPRKKDDGPGPSGGGGSGRSGGGGAAGAAGNLAAVS